MTQLNINVLTDSIVRQTTILIAHGRHVPERNRRLD
jgi:hypothetical protein